MPHNELELQRGGSGAVLCAPTRTARLTSEVWVFPSRCLQCSSTGNAKRNLCTNVTWIFSLGVCSTGDLVDRCIQFIALLSLALCSAYSLILFVFIYCQDFFSSGYWHCIPFAILVFPPDLQFWALAIAGEATSAGNSRWQMMWDC